MTKGNRTGNTRQMPPQRLQQQRLQQPRQMQEREAALRRQKRRRRRTVRNICVIVLETVLCAVLLVVLWNQVRPALGRTADAGKNTVAGKKTDGGQDMGAGTDAGKTAGKGDSAGKDAYAALNRKQYPQELQELLELNEETLDYVTGYPDRDSYIGQPIDLADDFTAGEVPLLMQWDRRWGYDMYGSSMIGLSGCGPLCLTMAYLYFTEDTEMTPREMAEYAQDNGYHTSAGTSWDLWTEGAEKLGLRGREAALDERSMQAVLDSGGLIVCSMRPGDFTTTGHFILIRGYDENGFFVNDPNRRSNSERQWDFDTLRYQIKNLWELRGGGGSPS